MFTALSFNFSDSLSNLLLEYLLNEKRPDGSTACAVENFHVRNGAVLWRVNFGANMAPYGMDESLSMMVNYRDGKLLFKKLINQIFEEIKLRL